MSKKPSEEEVRQLAHRLWEQRGRPQGRSEEDWYAAEKRLSGEGAADSRAVDESVKESFPASDAPGSNLPDQPPANAEEKWAAAARKKRPKKKSANDERARTTIDEPREVPRRDH
ncbi:MAG TPA: DUF2934 domain-containing protein [Gammaproteobacteria bacterium]|nr:DUF2934 domain-containing protein [Gammaproteobacteria bacterium]